MLSSKNQSSELILNIRIHITSEGDDGDENLTMTLLLGQLEIELSQHEVLQI